MGKMKEIVMNDLPIVIERKKIKNMYLRLLPPQGEVHISAPERMPEEEIRRFILLKYDWIVKQQLRMRQRPEQKVLAYESGEEVYYRGKKYTLQVIPSAGSMGVSLLGDNLILRVKPGSSPEARAKILNLWYREALTEVIPELLHKWEKVIGVKSSAFTIRDMKTRWGTCNIRTGKICFNLQLAKKDRICLEYVVVHELVHLLEGSHNKVFKAYMDQFLPNWRTMKKELNS